MASHRIHLKGPWQYEWLSPFGDPGPERGPSCKQGQIKMPGTWRSVFGDAAGTVRFRRRFGCPTNLDANERVILVFDGIAGTGKICLNDHLLGKIPPDCEAAEYEITPILKSTRNEVVAELHFDPGSSDKPGGLWGPVALEIRAD